MITMTHPDLEGLTAQALTEDQASIMRRSGWRPAVSGVQLRDLPEGEETPVPLGVKMVEAYNPNTQATAQVAASALQIMRASGWMLKAEWELNQAQSSDGDPDDSASDQDDSSSSSKSSARKSSSAAQAGDSSKKE